MPDTPGLQADPATLIRNLNSLLEVSKALGAEPRLDSLLGVIVSKATEVMEAERSSLFVYDEPTETLSIRIAADVAQGQIRIPLGTGIAGHVARTLEPLNVPDAYADPRFNPQVDRDTGFQTRSILCAPALTNGGRLIGVIQVLNKVDRPAFTADDERLLSAFAAIAGIALERSRLVEAFLEKEKIEASLRLANSIQMGMLPREFPRRPELDLSATLRPARQVGGDLYDFHLEGDRLWFVVGDVSGKGVPAALFMTVTKVLFGANVELESSPSAVAGRMNRALCRDNEQSLFVSAFLGRLDLATGELLFVNAGHNPPYRIGRDGSVAPLATPPSLVLGLHDGFEYRTDRVRLEPGDGLFAFTDGITEAVDGDGQLYGERRLEAALSGAAGRTAGEVVGAALSALDAYVGAAPQFDDITALALRYRAGS